MSRVDTRRRPSLFVLLLVHQLGVLLQDSSRQLRPLARSLPAPHPPARVRRGRLRFAAFGAKPAAGEGRDLAAGAVEMGARAHPG